MSGQWQPDEHPDATALAEYQAGLTSGPRRGRLAAHIASCPRCAAVGDHLAAVSSALAAAPAPPLPDAVERRIAAALASEAGRATQPYGATQPDGATQAPSATGASHARRHASPGRSRSPGGSRHDAAGPGRRRRSLPGARRFRPAVVLSSAAGLVLIGVAVLVGVSHLPGSSSSSSAAGSVASAPSTLSGGAAGQAPAASELAPGARQPAAAEGAAFRVTASGTRYQPATLAAQVRAEMANRSNAAGQAPPATLAACVAHLTGNVPPSLVDRATYQGKPAYVIAVADRVWVVGLGCTASDPHLITSKGL